MYFLSYNSTPVNFNPQVTNYLEQVQNEDYLIEKEKFISLRNKKRNLQKKYIENIGFEAEKNLEKKLYNYIIKKKKLERM